VRTWRTCGVSSSITTPSARRGSSARALAAQPPETAIDPASKHANNLFMASPFLIRFGLIGFRKLPVRFFRIWAR
jgi:hypothetical protein